MTALKQGMDGAGLDVLLAASQENFFYLADTLLLSQKMLPTRLCIAVLPRDEPPAAVVCYCEELQTRQDSWITDIHTYLEFQENPLQALAELLCARGLGAARIGIEERFLAASYVQELACLVPEATWVGADHVFDAARAIKTATEIDVMTGAARLTEQSILQTFQAATPGDTEKETADALSSRVLNAGGPGTGSPLPPGPTRPSTTPTPAPSRSPQARSCGPTFRVPLTNGYQSDVARTAAISAASDEQRSTYQRLREAQRETIAAARPRTRACDLYVRCKRALKQKGLSITSQAVGHGFGIGLHEFPVLHAHETAEIRPNMVLSIEPAVKDSNGYLYHTEDTLVVTDGDPRILTTVMATDELFVIG